MKNKSSRKIVIIILILIVLAALISLGICHTGLYSPSSHIPQETQAKAETTQPSTAPKNSNEVLQPYRKLKTKKLTTYYCIKGAGSYKRLQRKFKNNWLQMKKNYMKHRQLKYNLAWYKKGGQWYLDMSGWNFSVKQDSQKQQEEQTAEWQKKPCFINKSKTVANCKVVLFRGVLWQLKFSRYEGTFVKVLLHRKAISEKAISAEYTAKVLRIKIPPPDTNTCFRDGKSPIQDVIIMARP